jgi:hypothetical protein
MALQGRKPGWLLDKILGREEYPPASKPAPEVEPRRSGRDCGAASAVAGVAV